MRRAAGTLLLALPFAFFVSLYWFGLHAWFQQDDFAWLAQGLHIESWRDLPRALFAPRAQGTIRPWSERLFFLVLYRLFGMNPAPFHLWVAVTQAANLVLLLAVTMRMTRSRAAAVMAACVWLAGIGLATPLSWLSAYNQVLCAFFLLLAFLLLLTFIETGNVRWWWAQAAVFVLGFGALEITVVYPTLAAAWCWLYARPHLKRTLWLLPVSALYAALHFLVAPTPQAGPYTLHLDLTIMPTFLRYLRDVLAAASARSGTDLEWPATAAAAVLAFAASAFVILAARRGDRGPAYGVLWFGATLAPVLPLRDHYSAYYLAIPSLGLAWVAGAALAHARRSRSEWRAATVALLALHMALVLPVNRRITAWHRERGERARSLVEGLRQTHELRPDRLVVLTGVDSDLFWAGFFDKPYRVLGLNEVCLAPGSERAIEPHPEVGAVGRYVCAPAAVARAAAANRLVVFACEHDSLSDITERYVREIPAAWSDTRPRVVDIGPAESDDHLGGGWYASEGAFRWMGKRATVTISGPEAEGEALQVKGFRPESLLDRPVVLTVFVAGRYAGSRKITRDSSAFAFTVPLPAGLVGRGEIEVVLEVDRTTTPAHDGRELGLVFGTIERLPG